MKLPFWGTILTMIGLIVLCSLGTWQIQRLEWKENILAQIAEERTVSELTPENEYALATVTGRYLFDKEILIAPRTHKGESGYHIITPLQTDNKTVLVNRGWVPLDHQTSEDNKTVTVTGMIRTPPKGNIFTPPNNPAQNQWYNINLAEIAAAKNLTNLAPVLLYDTGTDTLELQLNNNHRQYAWFWFSMAAAMLLIYILRFIKKP